MTARELMSRERAGEAMRYDHRPLEFFSTDQFLNVASQPSRPRKFTVAGGFRRKSARLSPIQSGRSQDIKSILRQIARNESGKDLVAGIDARNQYERPAALSFANDLRGLVVGEGLGP